MSSIKQRERTKLYREEYRKQYQSNFYSGPLHLSITSLICLSVMVFSLLSLKTLQLKDCLWIPALVLLGNFVEYWGHRGPMHHRVPFLRLLFRRHTIEHHQFFTLSAPIIDRPEDYRIVLFPPYVTLFYLGVIALPLAYLVHQVLGPNPGFIFLFYAFFHYFCYEWLHLYFHLPPHSFLSFWDKLSFFRYLKEHHRLHHHPPSMIKKNFNLTLPIMDSLMGTLEKNPHLHLNYRNIVKNSYRNTASIRSSRS